MPLQNTPKKWKNSRFFFKLLLNYKKFYNHQRTNKMENHILHQNLEFEEKEIIFERVMAILKDSRWPPKI